MKIKQSFILNGPQISDVLSGALIGLDLSGTGIDGGSPGDTSYFNLFVSVEATEAEKLMYDYIQGLKVYLSSNDSYAGDSSAALDLTDILHLGDLGYGLAIKNPATGAYDIRFTSANYNTEANALVIPKEMLLYYDLTIPAAPAIIGYDGFNTAVANVSSNGYTLILNSSVFVASMVGSRVFNTTDGTSAVIDQYVSGTTVILKTSIGNAWDGDSITVKSLREPHDGALAVGSEVGEWLGNYAKLPIQFSLPSDYKRNGVKQFSFKFTSGNE